MGLDRFHQLLLMPCTADQVQFRPLHIRVLLRTVTRNRPPDATGDQPNHGTEPERRPPAMMQDEPRQNRWSESTARAYTGEDEAIYETPFFRWKPLHHKLIRG